MQSEQLMVSSSMRDKLVEIIKFNSTFPAPGRSSLDLQWDVLLDQINYDAYWK